MPKDLAKSHNEISTIDCTAIMMDMLIMRMIRMR